MLEGDFGVERSEEIRANSVQNESNKPVLRREPSFSGWCDEHRIDRLDCPSNNVDVSVGDCSFELPLVQGDRSVDGVLGREIQEASTFRHRSMLLNGAHNMGEVSVYIEGNGDGKKYVPFDVENEPGGEQQVSDFNSDGTDSGIKLDTSQAAQSSISISTVLRTLFFVLVWYTTSTCLTLYNKTLLGDKLGNFPAPMLMNTVHFTMQAILSKVIMRFCCQNLQPSVEMSWRDYFMRVVPTAIGTALDINLSNASLVFISVTFATMCKSASPIFLLLFAFAFKLESPSIKLLGIILIISAGILLTVAKETEFELWGFLFVILAAFMAGFRWSMTQILLQKEAFGLKHPLAFMSYVAPVMAVATALSSLVMDPWLDFKRNDYFNNSENIARSCMLMVIGGSLAFLMVLTEYILVSETSAVTVTIAGVVKEAVTILVAVFYFHDEFTLMKGIGLITIMVGVSLFNWYKYQKLQKGQLSENAEETGSPTAKGAAKYVILENMDDQDDEV